MSILSFSEISEQKHEALVTKNSSVLVAWNFVCKLLIRSYEVLPWYALTCDIGNEHVGFWNAFYTLYSPHRPQYFIIIIWFQCSEMKWKNVLSFKGFVTLCSRYSAPRLLYLIIMIWLFSTDLWIQSLTFKDC